ncbi:hypothetical protein Vi05172_g11067 [Venturia inaequalis]|nr:hypothetical protein Vi05172_g11067 [Venturia inaequalis]
MRRLTWKAAKKSNADKKPASMGKDSGYEFIDTIFGRDRELNRTEKLISAIRFWSMRFDANCDDILRNPTAGYDKATTRDTAPCNGDPTTPQPIPSSASDEACKDPLGNAVPSADQTVVSSKKKLDDMHAGPAGDAGEVDDMKGIATPTSLKHKAPEDLEKEQAYEAKRTKAVEELGNEAVT